MLLTVSCHSGRNQWRNYGGGGGGVVAPPPPIGWGKNKIESDSRHTHMGVDPGGMGDISPQYFRWGGGGMACIMITPLPPIFHDLMSYYTDKISEVPTKIMKEIAGLKCRNATSFLARIHRYKTYKLSRCGRVAGSL